MNKKMIALAVPLIVLLNACNSGGNSSPSTPIYLPQGTYMLSYSNVSPQICQDAESASFTVTSDGNGNLAGTFEGTVGLNLANNPCMTGSENANGLNYTETWNSCNLNGGNTLTANANINFTMNGQSQNCTANVTVTPSTTN